MVGLKIVVSEDRATCFQDGLDVDHPLCDELAVDDSVHRRWFHTYPIYQTSQKQPSSIGVKAKHSSAREEARVQGNCPKLSWKQKSGRLRDKRVGYRWQALLLWRSAEFRLSFQDGTCQSFDSFLSCFLRAPASHYTCGT